MLVLPWKLISIYSARSWLPWDWIPEPTSGQASVPIENPNVEHTLALTVKLDGLHKRPVC